MFGGPMATAMEGANLRNLTDRLIGRHRAIEGGMPISTVIARPTSCSALAASVGLESRHTYRYRTATVWSDDWMLPPPSSSSGIRDQRAKRVNTPA